MADKLKCYHLFPNGDYCNKWARNGSRFCHHHQPMTTSGDPKGLHPYARLATPEDLFHFLREAMLSVRLGHIAPGQAYAVAALVDRWLKVRRETDFYAMRKALQNQILPTLVDQAAAAEAECEAGMEEEALRNSQPPGWWEEAERAAAVTVAPREAEAQAGQDEAAPSPPAAASPDAKAAPVAQPGAAALQPAPAAPAHPEATARQPSQRDTLPVVFPSPPTNSGPASSAQGKAAAEPARSGPAHEPDGNGGSAPQRNTDFASRILSHLEREVARSLLGKSRHRPRDR